MSDEKEAKPDAPVRAPPPKMAPPGSKPPDAAADAKGTGDPSKKPPAKKALPPPANPPPQGSTSAAAAFRAKSALPPPSGPPPNGPTASASVAKIRGAARPPSGAPPPGGANGAALPKPALAPPSGAPPTKSEAKPPSNTPVDFPDSKGDGAKPAMEAKPEAKRMGAPPAARPPSASAGAKPTPKSAPSQPLAKPTAAVDILGDTSPEFVLPAAKQIPAATSEAVPTPKPALQPKPEAQPVIRPTATAKPLMTGSELLDPALLKPQGPKKSTMEVLNDTTAALTTRRSTLGDDYEVPPTVVADIGNTRTEEVPTNGVYASKMGKAAQFSGFSRPNAPEEEVLVVKKVETKPVQEDKISSGGKQGEESTTQAGAKSVHHIPRLDDSFDDVEEIPFLDELKPEPKGKDLHKDSKATPSTLTGESDDPEVIIESKHGPPKVRGAASSSHSEAKKEQKEDDSDREKNISAVADGDQPDDSNDDIYHELRKLKRRSPRENDDGRDSFSTQSGAAGGMHIDEAPQASVANNEKKESRDSETDSKDSATEESHGTTSNGREKFREKRKERRRHKHEDEPKKIQAQFYNPKSVPYVPDHLLEFVKKPLECGRGHIVKCFIERNDSGSNKLAPIYTLLLEVNSSSGRPIMYARKKASSRITSHYVISMNKEDLFLSRMLRSHQYVGKLRSSTSMMEYCLYDQGDNPEDLDSDCEVDDELRQSIRAELAVIRYHNSKKSYARKMEVAIPSIVDNGSAYLDWRPLSRDQMMEEHVRAITAAGGQNVLDTSNFIFMHKRETKYDPLSSCIVDFRSRATCVSVKNFQLVHSEPASEAMRAQYRQLHPDYVYEDQGTVSLPQEHVILQLGKVGKDCFNMDFQYPLSMLQAFAISLSRFDTKQR